MCRKRTCAEDSGWIAADRHQLIADGTKRPLA